VLVSANAHVTAGRPLLQIEPLGDAPAAAAGERLRFDAAESSVGGLQRLAWAVLGYDVAPAEVRRIADAVLAAPVDGAAERRLLEIYADVRALNRPHPDAGQEAQAMGSPQEHLHAFLRSLDPVAEGLPERFVAHLEAAVAHYGITGLERTAALEEAGYRLFLSQQRAAAARAAVQSILTRRLDQADDGDGDGLRGVLDRLESTLRRREPSLAELARELRWRTCDEPLVEAAREETARAMEAHVVALAEEPGRADRDERIAALVDCPEPLAPLLSRVLGGAGPLIEAMTRRYYRIRTLDHVEQRLVEGVPFVLASYEHRGVRHHVAATLGEPDDLSDALRALAAHAATLPQGEPLLADFYAREPVAGDLERLLAEPGLPPAVARATFVLAPWRGRGAVDVVTFTRRPDGSLTEARDLRGLHPMMAERMELWRLSNFALERLDSAPDVYLFRAVAHDNPRDERLVALAEVRDVTPVRDEAGRITALPELERMVREAFEAMRSAQAGRPARQRMLWNRVLLYAWPKIDFHLAEASAIIARFAHETAGLGLELVLLRAQMPVDGTHRDRALRIFNPAGRGVVVEVSEPPTEPLRPLDEGAQRIVSARRRGTLHPAEIVKILAPQRSGAIPAGEFVEHDLDDGGELVPVERPPATNRASIVVGLIRNRTERYPEGMLRVALLGDPTRSLGSLAEPECRRVIAALDLAESLDVPVEWFAVSSGAKIAMDSGTENMDWVAAALRRIVQFTQAGGEINIVVTGINVGAQPYFNAEATMLMHTKGILVMAPDSAMVLTGKQALDYSGGVSAEDNFGIGGFDRVMGPNGQAQYWAPDLAGACEILLRYYEHTYVAPGERFPRRAQSSDPHDRDISSAPHDAPDSDLATVGEIFSEATNPGRKKAFDIRSVMRAVADSDDVPLERWAGMAEAEIAVAWDARLGGRPVAMLGIESRPLPRFGSVPADGPEQWTSGTLFPAASKKIARVINAASGRRPLVVLANLAGFDGSPESMRRLQLEYGAEIGRAIVNFDGPIAFCVISRFHGGAFVVFSRRLNDQLETIALEGAHASVIGGAPAAAVVFAREVDVRTGKDARIAEIDERIAASGGAERGRLRAERERRWTAVRSEKLGELAAEFDAIHSVARAVAVGSVDRVIAASALRADLIDTVERGIRRTESRASAVGAS
jgi:acetyl-CoA carboxylase carboxyltransferase component